MSKTQEITSKFIVEFPEHEEDVTLVFNDSFPIDTIFIGQTYPFSSYKIHRRETAGRHLFEFVLGGRGEIEIDGKRMPLSAGDTFFLGKGSMQDYHSDKKDPLKKIWVSLRSDYIDAMLESYRIKTGVYKVNVKNNFLAIYNIARAATSQQDKFFEVADNLHEIITALSKSVLLSESDTVSVIKNELLSAVYSKTTLDEIAARLFISKSGLIRIFKKSTGVTPYQFLLDEKLSVAKALLSSTDMTVKAISDMLCFTDEHYFSYLFKQKTGRTPTEYKKTTE